MQKLVPFKNCQLSTLQALLVQPDTRAEYYGVPPQFRRVWGIFPPDTTSDTNTPLYHLHPQFVTIPPISKELFKKPTTIGQCSSITDPGQAIADILAGATTAIQSALTWTPSAANTAAFSKQLAASITFQPDGTAPFTTINLTRAAEAATAIHANSAKPRWTLAQQRQARQLIWAVGGSIIS